MQAAALVEYLRGDLRQMPKIALAAAAQPHAAVAAAAVAAAALALAAAAVAAAAPPVAGSAAAVLAVRAALGCRPVKGLEQVRNRVCGRPNGL